MNDNIKRQKIVLAALLHDIGKFCQQADDKKDGQFMHLKEHWNLDSTFYPQYKGVYSRKHVLWTAKFFDDYKSVFSKVIQDGYSGEDSLMRLAAHHHKPEIPTQKIIQLADWFSSGVERNNDPASIDDGIAESDNLAFKKKRMVSIFEGLQQEGNLMNKYRYNIPISPLLLGKDFFPKKISEFTTNPNYEDLWLNFTKDFTNLPQQNFDIFFKSLLGILEKYIVTIPSSTIHLTDVSLFDHSKMTAAFSVCLYDYFKERNNISEIELDNKDAPILLVGGDISGIQNFIYDIISKNAAKNLKGRSFYLQLMVDSIIQYILKELDLYETNIVYSSGGGFFILAPNTKKVLEKLKEIERNVSNKIYEEHKTGLFIALDNVPISKEKLLRNGDKDIGDVWSNLFKKLNKKKRQRYSHDLLNKYSDFFEPTDIGGKVERDAITGEELLGDKRSLPHSGEYVNRNTFEQIELGKDLRKVDYWMLTDYDAGGIIKKNSYEPLKLGIHHYFFSKEDMISSIPDMAHIKLVNLCDFSQSFANAKYSTGFSLYGGNASPVLNKPVIDNEGNILLRKGDVKPFDNMVGKGDLKRLGVLRMDVDNLGQIFINGFDKNKRTFSRYASLSRNLDYFFKGYLNKIHQTNPEYKENTIILYSGGDDLFIIGKWDLLINMAKDIRKKFAAWTCYNPKISLSGGIAIVGHKFPIMKAAKMAAKEEKNAKSYNKGEKDAFSMMEYALSWKKGKEFEVVEELKNKFMRLLDSKNSSVSLIRFISGLNEQRKLQIRKNRNESWQWLLVYQLSRYKDRNKEQKNFIDQIKNDVFADTYNGQKMNLQYHFLELLTIAARWAELEFRTNKRQ